MLAADSCPDPNLDPNPMTDIPNNSSIETETENPLKKSLEKPKNKRVKLNKPEKIVKEKVPKEKKQEKLDSNQSQEIILNYLNSQNRPYNAVDVFNNLKGVLSKQIVVKILAELVSKDLVIGKSYGKTEVYCAKQIVTENQQSVTQQLNETAEKLKTEISNLNMELKDKNSILNKIVAVPKTSDAKITLQLLIEKNDALEKNLANFKNGNVMDAKQQAVIEGAHAQAKESFRKRKKLFKEMWGAVTESHPDSPKVLMAKLGIEDDESVGFDFAAIS